jgi:hypothetical protein
MPSRFSQRWTVLTSRFRYAAMSFQESSRSEGPSLPVRADNGGRGSLGMASLLATSGPGGQETILTRVHAAPQPTAFHGAALCSLSPSMPQRDPRDAGPKRSNHMMERNWKPNRRRVLILIVSSALACEPGLSAQDSSGRAATLERGQAIHSASEPDACAGEENAGQVLEWNQIFIDTLVATNTANSSSQRLGAIVHTAIFDAYNGIERRYAPIFVQRWAAKGASRRAAVIAAAYTALVGCSLRSSRR